MPTPVKKIVSGGQTGVDRAALDIAAELGIPAGGWCPRGRKAEDGPIPARFPLQEAPTELYAQRTQWNVRDSDATLILTVGELTGGTALTKTSADELGRPCLVIDLAHPPDRQAVLQWLRTHNIRVLNIAGPRESTQPGIYEQAAAFLRHLLASSSSGSRPPHRRRMH